MAIGTGAAIDFFGTQDELTSSASSVASDAFSVIGDTGTWTNDDDAKEASVTFNGTLAVAAAVGAYIDLYVRKMNVQSTNDDIEPSTSFYETHVGTFTMAVGTAQLQTIDINLSNYKTSSEYDFYIQNKSGQSLNSSWALHITPKAINQHA